MARQRAGYHAHSFTGAFHNIVTTSTMDVHIEEAGNGGGVDGRNFLGPRREGHIVARADGLNNTIANENAGAGYFGCRSESARSVKQKCAHREVHIVAEIGQGAKTKRAEPKFRPGGILREDKVLLALDWRHVDAGHLQVVALDRALHGHMMTGVGGHFLLVIDGVDFLVGIVDEH